MILFTMNQLSYCYYIEHHFETCDATEFKRDLQKLCTIHARQNGSELVMNSFGGISIVRKRRQAGKPGSVKSNDLQLERGSLEKLIRKTSKSICNQTVTNMPLPYDHFELKFLMISFIYIVKHWLLGHAGQEAAALQERCCNKVCKIESEIVINHC